jgi:hypothetical protein
MEAASMADFCFAHRWAARPDRKHRIASSEMSTAAETLRRAKETCVAKRCLAAPAGTSGANLTFEFRLPQTFHQTSNSKARLESKSYEWSFDPDICLPVVASGLQMSEADHEPIRIDSFWRRCGLA